MKYENAVIVEVGEWVIISYKITIADIAQKEYDEEEPILKIVHLLDPQLGKVYREESNRIPVTILR